MSACSATVTPSSSNLARRRTTRPSLRRRYVSSSLSVLRGESLPINQSRPTTQRRPTASPDSQRCKSFKRLRYRDPEVGLIGLILLVPYTEVKATESLMSPHMPGAAWSGTRMQGSCDLPDLPSEKDAWNPRSYVRSCRRCQRPRFQTAHNLVTTIAECRLAATVI